MKKCNLCPRMCGIDRTAGETGYCRMPAGLYIARAALHHWEEPCIAGSHGAGAVFFTGCNMRCVFCQNYEISGGECASSKEVSTDKLADIFLDLQSQGADSIDLVTPTHYMPAIGEALDASKAKGLHLPVAYNCSGYERKEVIEELEPYVNAYMPDFKYWSDDTAAAYSNAPNYVSYAKAALSEMVSQKKLAFDDNGIMTSGVLVRHLVLPGHTKESIALLHYLADTFGDDIYISILGQYTPISRVLSDSNLGRRLTRREYDKVVDAAIEIGLENVYIQDISSASSSFTPDFDGTGIM
ncbi:MAG: radical SAM protein [Lachnospiraceae bacterium]|nr:radical SAM protein [Candidatus Minthocola equi]